MEHKVNKAFFITGTDTDVGKTQVTAALAAYFHECCKEHVQRLSLWKPVQSGYPYGHPQTDSARLLQLSQLPISENEVVTYTFADPLAPWMAARRAEMNIDFEQLVQLGTQRIAAHDLLLIEGAGGLGVPITQNHLIVDLMERLNIPTIIVARTGLGTVNHTLLSISYLRQRQVPILGVILNDVQRLESHAEGRLMIAENIEMIERFSNLPVWGVIPWFEHKSSAQLAQMVVERLSKYIHLLGGDHDDRSTYK